MDLDAAAVADFDPALVSHEPHRTRAERLHPAGTLSERCLEKVEHKFDSIGVAGRHLAGRWLIFHGHGVVGLVGPLAEIYGVGAPVQQPSPRVEVPVTAPAS